MFNMSSVISKFFTNVILLIWTYFMSDLFYDISPHKLSMQCMVNYLLPSNQMNNCLKVHTFQRFIITEKFYKFTLNAASLHSCDFSVTDDRKLISAKVTWPLV
jgi:hypothetical protein